MKPRRNLLNHRFGRLLVICESGRAHRQVTWLCQCDCGKQKVYTSGDLLRKGDRVKRSCGCLTREERIRHGHAVNRKSSPEYTSWVQMRARCNNPKNVNFPWWGARGIRVCDYWDTFENFLSDMGPRPIGKSLDRINNEGHYVPSNCRWATPKEQANNRRDNKCKKQ